MTSHVGHVGRWGKGWVPPLHFGRASRAFSVGTAPRPVVPGPRQHSSTAASVGGIGLFLDPVPALQRREVRTRDSTARQTEGRRAGESESLNSSTVQKLAFGQRQHSGTGVELESSETRKRGASDKILVTKDMLL